jgi:tetratricopeptide (TPR) repeat protein
MALNNLGPALRKVRRFEEAISAQQDAAAIFRETGDRHSEGLALVGLGLALVEVRRFEEAISACQDAVATFRETADRYWEDMALDNLEKYRAAQALSNERQ